MSWFKRNNQIIQTVDGAIEGLNTALDNLATVRENKRIEHESLSVQANELLVRASIAKSENERADRIHKNITNLLK